jgi:GDP-L-fucose synthase
MKKIAITGGKGFLGRYVAKQFTEKGYAVVPLSSTDYNLMVPSQAMEMYQDINPDAVIHLAASVGGIGANRKNPGVYFHENMTMGMNIIEAGREYGVEKIVLAGTVCSYPKHTPVPFTEESLWDGYPEETNAPYGIAKKALLVMAQAYREQYGLNSIFLMPVNLYGPNDNFDPSSSHVIPALIKKVVDAKRSNAKAIELWGTGEASREFLYVEDAARAIVAATEQYDGAEPVNIGAGQEIKICDLAEIIAEVAEWEGGFVYDSTKPDGQPRRCLNTEKAKKHFGFEARIDLCTGLSKTIEWYENHEKSKNKEELFERILWNALRHIEDWHGEQKETFEEDLYKASVKETTHLAYKIAYHNYQIWHWEDIARKSGMDDKALAKSNIDPNNQARNDAIEKIDQFLIQFQKGTGPYNSETIGSIIDRIIINKLKMLHVMGFKDKAETRLPILTQQHNTLVDCGRQLIKEMVDGTRQILDYKQLKMYNDPSTNPLYGK